MCFKIMFILLLFCCLFVAATLNQLRAEMIQQFNDDEHNYKFSTSTLCRMLLHNNYTTKNITYEPQARNTPSNIRERKEYCLEAACWDRNELVFIDEFGNIDLRIYICDTVYENACMYVLVNMSVYV